MIATGYGCISPNSLCFSKRTEVIDLQITNNRCSKLESYPTPVTLASGGLLNGKPVICGGQSRSKQTFSHCYILEQWFSYFGSSSVDLLMCRSWNFESWVYRYLLWFFLCLLFTEKINFLLVKFSFYEKATKICAICLMVLRFTK